MLWQAGTGWSAQFGEKRYLSPETRRLWASALFWFWLTWDFPRLGSDWGTGLLALVQEHEALPENSSACRPQRPWSAWTVVLRTGWMLWQAGFPTAFGVRAELGNSRPSELQRAYLASSGNLAELA